MYDNQTVIDAESRKLKEVDPDWNIGAVGLDGNKVISISITVPIKGNTKKIRRLEADGWKCTFRKKVRGNWFEISKDTGKMMQCMRKYISEE